MTTVDRHPAGTPCWLDLMTPDPEIARDFYEEVFAWDYAIGPPESGPYTMCTIKDRAAAGMGPLPADAPMPSAWTVYFASDDVDATAKRVGELGGKVMIGPMDVFEEGRLLIAADPTGAVFGVWQPKKHKGAGVVDEHGSLAWCEVNTREGAKARDFYAALFDLQPKELDLHGTKYWTLDRGGKSYAGILQMNEQWPAEVPPHWMPYFAVDDTDEAAVRIDAAGGSVSVPPFDTPYGRLAVCGDRGGAYFSIIKPEPR